MGAQGQGARGARREGYGRGRGGEAGHRGVAVQPLVPLPVNLDHVLEGRGGGGAACGADEGDGGGCSPAEVATWLVMKAPVRRSEKGR